ncbi:MAG: hypothetical protein ACI89L_002759 [Phycisphaerales bacterium]|jgi:hypothetical protein
MLKFLRKYQLYIMIVGGSLLMVVFLLEPVITRLAPTGAGVTVATIGPDDQKISAQQRETANAEYSAIRNIAPVLLTPYFIGIDQKEPGDHWLLLTREAEQNGLIGEAGDGRTWIPELTQVIAQTEARLTMMQQFANLQGVSQGLIDMLLNQPQAQQDIANRAAQLQADFPLYVNRATAANPYLKTTDDTYRALAKARGVMRLLALHRTAPRRSTPEANAVISRTLDGVAADMLLLTPDLLAGSVPAPTQEQLQAHFDRFRDTLAADSDLGIGYVLPPRVKLEYLKLDAQAIASAVTVDRVEISKRFQRNPTAYGTSLESASLNDPTISVAQNIEQQIRTEQTKQLIVQADRAIRGAMLTATRDVPTNDDGTLDRPDGWQPPTLESIAQTIAATVKLPSGDPMPLPPVIRHASSWLTSEDVAALPGVGTSAFRIGTTGYRAEAIPYIIAEYLDEGTLNEVLPIEVGVPYVTTSATDDLDNHYYVNVIEARNESAAEGIDEVGADKVLADYNSVQAFEQLKASQDGYLDVARTSDLDGLAAQFSETAPPVPAQNIILRESAEQTPGFPQTAAAVNTQELRDAVLDAARERLGPLQAPQDVEPLDAYLAVEVPATRSLAVFKLVARRPVTKEQILSRGYGILQGETNTELTDVDDFISKFPYTFETLKKRHNFKLVKKNESATPDGFIPKPVEEETPNAEPAAEDTASETEAATDTGSEQDADTGTEQDG